jgi:hypothetical protein
MRFNRERNCFFGHPLLLNDPSQLSIKLLLLLVVVVVVVVVGGGGGGGRGGLVVGVALVAVVENYFLLQVTESNRLEFDRMTICTLTKHVSQ